MTVDLNTTLTFLRVVEGGSFTAAARALRLPKTTVSRHVRELEQHLGAQLLHRTTRKLSLTEAGSLYYERCKTVTSALADAESAVAHLQGAPRGRLRVTSSYSLMIHLVGPLLAPFRLVHPQVELDLTLSHRTLDLVEEQVDLALRLGPLADSTLVARRLATLPNRVWASPAYLERHGAPSHPRELVHHAALVTRVARHGASHAWPMSRGDETDVFEVKPVIESDDPEVLRAPLLAGAGLMMATDLIMARDAEAGRVVPLLPGWLGRCPELHAVFPAGRVIPPKLRVFVDFLSQQLEVLRAGDASSAAIAPATPPSRP